MSSNGPGSTRQANAAPAEKYHGPPAGSHSVGEFDIDALDWDKMDGLVPAIVQDAASGELLMLGYVNRDALAATIAIGLVTFYSRTRKALWQKGESSGNTLHFKGICSDCDSDALLILAEPQGPTCHTGKSSCFGAAARRRPFWLEELEGIVRGRAERPREGSYTTELLDAGPRRVAQKVGEEGVEVAIAGAIGDNHELTEEVADLIYHLTVLLQARRASWADVGAVLRRRRGDD